MTSVYLLSGFLGAGKTSLMQHILSTGVGPDTVVFVNEFGRLGLDGKLIQREGLSMYELNNGCICCSLKDELELTLERAIRERKPRKILIEASGVADPGSIVRLIASLPKVQLAPTRTITVVDGRAWMHQRSIGKLYLSQLEQADLIIFNKTDLVPARKLDSLIASLQEKYPDTRVVPAVRGVIDPAVFWGVPEPDKAAVENAGHEDECEHDHDHEHGHDHEHHHHDHEFSEVVFRTDGVMDRKGLDAFLARLPENVDRAKGQVVFPGETLYLDVVGDEISWRRPPEGLTGTCLVFIGRKLDEKSLQDGLKALVLPA